MPARMPLLPVRPTPLEPLDRLGAAIGLGTGRLFVKRDDMTGIGGGGNKARKLEYLAADAVAKECDVLVTGGGRQSNHARMTAAVAGRLGMGCTLVLSGGQPSVPSGNVLLDHLLGADIVWAASDNYGETEAAIAAETERLWTEGRRPYLMPIGGASDLGALGYVDGARELLEQCPDLALVVTASGSGGTQAGLVAGLGDHGRVLGVDVGARDDLEQVVPAKARAVADLAALPAPDGAMQLDRDRIGAGYAATTDETLAALRLAARTEGLLLDPVYTGKAMAGLIAGAREGRLPDGPIVFLHTGGLPALFARSYAEWILS